MPWPAADTLRILIATDSHVGYNERDPIRGNDSATSFNEVLELAQAHDVDMILLSGDLFHDNKPSRKAMYDVMKSLRQNCLGEKPCELEILSDTSEVFQTGGGHVNYQDPDINVAIPVFSIHGNHDDPSGEGRMCALDLLAVSGFVNYFGRTHENDNITITPILLQKGGTKLALYGLSNVRDQRLYRTFADNRVRFLRPEMQPKEWFNLMCVHQNHVERSDKDYLPENFLQDFLDLVIWGHEHDCQIDPKPNTQMNFDVIQPGSSVATSLTAGEAIPKHCGILSIHGREYKLDPIRLKTVRPFVMKDIKLQDEPEAAALAKKANNRAKVTEFLVKTVDELIEQAMTEWREAQTEDGENEEIDPSVQEPLPLIRLRVEYSSLDGNFEIENPQRFSNRFVGKVANVNDVILYYRKKNLQRSAKTGKLVPVDNKDLDDYDGKIENIRVEKLVKEMMANTTLQILPPDGLGKAMGEFVDKDDKHALEACVEEVISFTRAEFEKRGEEINEDKIEEDLVLIRDKLEANWAAGIRKSRKGDHRRFKPKPDGWDTDIDGEWEDEPAALIRDVVGSDDDADAPAAGPSKPATRGRGRGRGARGGATTSRAKAVPKKAPAKKAPAGRGRKKKPVSEDDDDEDSDVMMLDDDDDDEDDEPIAPARTTARSRRQLPSESPAPTPKAPPKRAPARPRKAAASAPSQRAPRPKFSTQSQAASNVPDSQASNSLFHRAPHQIISDDEDIIEDDDFVSMDTQPTAAKSKGRR